MKQKNWKIIRAFVVYNKIRLKFSEYYLECSIMVGFGRYGDGV